MQFKAQPQIIEVLKFQLQNGKEDMRLVIMPPIKPMFEILQPNEEIQNPLKELVNLQHTIKDMPKNIDDSERNILECRLRHYLRKLIKH